MGTVELLKDISGTEIWKNNLERKRMRRNSCAEFVDTVLLHCHQVKNRNKFGKKG